MSCIYFHKHLKVYKDRLKNHENYFKKYFKKLSFYNSQNLTLSIF